MATILFELVELFLGNHGNGGIGNASIQSRGVHKYNGKWPTF
jgi:hypothetical protein